MVAMLLLAGIFIFLVYGLITIQIFQSKIKTAVKNYDIYTLKKVKKKIETSSILWLLFSRDQFIDDVDRASQIVWEQTERDFRLEELMREAEEYWKNTNGLTTSEEEEDDDEFV